MVFSFLSATALYRQTNDAGLARAEKGGLNLIKNVPFAVFSTSGFG